jgi:hypothetical protein
MTDFERQLRERLERLKKLLDQLEQEAQWRREFERQHGFVIPRQLN